MNNENKNKNVFICTRGGSEKVSFSEAILKPMTANGGLLVPAYLPNLDLSFLKKHLESSYKTLAKAILVEFNLGVPGFILDRALEAYDKFDDPNNPVPVVKVKDKIFISELYHGPTRAFKDMALQPFGVLLNEIAKQRDENYLILAATSGDTGPAALETCANKSNIKMVCLYPHGGTSDVQRLQMTTQSAKNLFVTGVRGDFDDTQNSLKVLLSSSEFNNSIKKSGYGLSAANSVNFGRIIFQIIYHVHSYLELVRQGDINLGDKINIAIPSGNFGNALSGYYALKMGLPFAKILTGSNENNVIYSLLKVGIYDLRGQSVTPTNSPAMDILKSSNIERILFDFFGTERTNELMGQLERDKRYKLTDDELSSLQEVFEADWSSNQDRLSIVYRYSSYFNYLMDTHTTTTIYIAEKYADESGLATVVYSTAEWTKFAVDIKRAIDQNINCSITDELALKEVSERMDIDIHSSIQKLFKSKENHTGIHEIEEIEELIFSFVAT